VNRFRLPYWDWIKPLADGEPAFPTVISSPTISVTYPNNGTTATIPNPLYNYKFHPLSPTYFSPPFTSVPTTVRAQDYDINDIMTSNAPFLRQDVYQLLTQYQIFNSFSNHGSETSFIGNLESVHDQIHGIVGGSNGHMGYVPVAAFDPVFWLHHCNVDRIAAIWQRIYPDTYVTPYAQAQSTWTIPAGSIQDANSNLTPFHRNTAGNFWNSNGVRLTDGLQYTYPEIQGNANNASIKAAVNALYAPSTTSVVSKRAADIPALAVSPEEPRSFLTAIEAPLAFKGIYSVIVFVGDITTPESDWLKDSNFAGQFALMSRDGALPDKVIKGSVVLNEALKKKFEAGELPSLQTPDIVAYLTKNLHWRVQQAGKEIPREQVPNFKVTVLSTEVKPAKSPSDFPTYVGGWTDHKEVTAGRPGGN
jgi:tyrosinase